MPRRQPPLTFRRRLVAAIRSAIITLGLVLAVMALWGVWTYLSPGPVARHGASTTVILRHGASLPEIATDLQTQGVIRSGSVFVAAAQLTGAARRLKAGEYAFPSRSTLAQVVAMMREGRIVRHFVTIPEGLTSAQVTAILMANPVLTGQVSTPPEGSILPETYEVARGDDRTQVLHRMMAARDRLLAELWPDRRADLPFRTPEDAVTLASIVEKETGLADERPLVAAVFVNRLEKGIPLASDPTIVYGLTGGTPLGHGIRQSELASVTPYNTYHFTGLTPTPICNPGRAAIAAVLDPARTDALYFVANGTGGHSFSATMAEHEKNVERWRAVERQRAMAQASGAPALSGAPAKSPLRGEASR
ncbi:MAG TPA: endolytic transglycosylase MltG [Caulobacteraceae bacterium]|nr:endolytic transglycosylase MltG [Caulobacteraceae bacterium]